MGIYFESYNNVYVRIMNHDEIEMETETKDRTISCVDGLCYETMPNSVVKQTGRAYSDYFMWREKIQALARVYNLSRIFCIPEMNYNDFTHCNETTKSIAYFLNLICEKIEAEQQTSIISEMCKFTSFDKLFTIELRDVYNNCNQKGVISIS
jgi:hypothetical protein